MSTFIVSGMGRSGTTWLAHLLRKSSSWEVVHEPTAQMDVYSIQQRLRDRHCSHYADDISYGEVNSYALAALPHLLADRKAVIVRDPLQIAVSMANVGHAITGVAIDHLAQSMALIDIALRNGAIPIAFREITTSLQYAVGTAACLGVQDLRITEADLAARVNASAGTATWLSFSEELRGRVERPCRWFREKYRDLGAMEVEA